MHPGIAYFPSQWFYGGLLKSGVTVEDRPVPSKLPWPNSRLPVMMLECEEGQDQKASSTGQGLSYINLEEAQLVMKVLWAATQGAQGVRDVVLLTPYKGQVKILEQLRRAINQYLEVDVNVIVSSVDAYQGQEAELVIFSTVRSNNKHKVGFLRDPRRLNVAITRARNGLVVVGSKATLNSSIDWRNWLDWIKANKAFQQEDSFPMAPWEDGFIDVRKVIEDSEEDYDNIIDVDNWEDDTNGAKNDNLGSDNEKREDVDMSQKKFKNQSRNVKKHKKVSEQVEGQNIKKRKVVIGSKMKESQNQKKDTVEDLKQSRTDHLEESREDNFGNQLNGSQIQKDLLKTMTVVNLRALCKQSEQVEIKGYSTMKKSQLIQNLFEQREKIDVEVLNSLYFD
eukprot:TRINITY_DN5981_c0_g1_i1.p1 TRINITY_DN5981_c0_g1~~TRINITY_DN5981_c0_g1_i1.p1  ORF type:complete len:395 (+),score=68.26 TRINITY_DN5981_c0_g1_i1:78-1262(+)